MANLPVGLQLYSVRQECAKDLPGVLQRVAQMGYEGVEFAGFYSYAAKDLRRMLDEVGLKCCGSHTPLSTLTEELYRQTVEFNLELGNRYLIVPFIPKEMRADRAGWLKMAERFNRLADLLEPLGCHTGYHNHHVEFEPVEGELPWDTFFGHTDERVIMQLDTGNALRGGAEVNPADFLRRYPGRALTVHLKDFSRSTQLDAVIDQGDVDFDEVFKACQTVGATRWYIVEYENPNTDAMTSVAECLAGVRAVQKRAAVK
ncbi:MAG: TIM barrel protein [Phycisphaeraceae bacterium]|nr:TIM barrel protein [Phycisphaeraceae bacterium]